MRRQTVWSRLSLALLAGLQFLLPGAVGWADARLDAAGAHAVAHVESHSSSSCARIHPPDCVLHQFLGAPLAVGPVRQTALTQAPHRVGARSDLATPASAQQRSHPQPRAPPPHS